MATPVPDNDGLPRPLFTKKSIFSGTPGPARDTKFELARNLDSNQDDDKSSMSPREAERALRDLVGSSMHHELNDDIEVDLDQATVPGFSEGIQLLPHQIIGRAWARNREDLSKKRTGGILADDMGLGKTILILTRMVEGRNSGVAEEWSALNLVVCPLALVGQWADEIQKMTRLKVLKHQGTTRTKDPNVFRFHDVVVTTYNTVKSEYMSYTPLDKPASKSSSHKHTPNNSDADPSNDDDDSYGGRTIQSFDIGKGKAAVKRSALFEIKWRRIVLDEAHNIKNVKTKVAVACCELQGKYRWCMTGTPIQNNVTELYSLFKFLRIKPLSNWDIFHEQIAKPINNGRGASQAMKRLQVVLKQIMLHRRKDQTLNGKALIELPKRTVEVITCPFDLSEREFYLSLESKMESVIKVMEHRKGGQSYISVLLLVLRLRQACDHPILVSKDYQTDTLQSKIAQNVEDGVDLNAAFGKMGVTNKCQMCTSKLDASNSGEGDLNTYCRDCLPLATKVGQLEKDRPSSAKIRMILKLLGEIDERSNSEERTIIFSQFTNMLDLIEPFLSENGIKYVRYDGSMVPKDREFVLEQIRTSSTVRVILISFKAGSTGLNLTACNNVILVDMWWNPALEDQAFDRAHRLGQKRDVNIFKLKVADTVEDRILTLQGKKRALAAATLSGDKLKGMQLGLEDLLALFRPGGKGDGGGDFD